MRVSIVSAAAIAAASFSAPALAEGHSEIERLADGRCFDKGILEFVDCPEEPVVVVAPIVEEPEDESGFYLGLRGGLAFFQDTEFRTGAANVTNEYDMGYAVSGFVGYAYADWIEGFTLRPELEIGYQAADIDNHDTGGGAIAGSVGDASVLFGFANLYGDVELTEQLDLILGAGVGGGQVSFDGFGVGTGDLLDDSDLSFGYHLDAGLGYEVIDDLTLELMYRYSSFVSAEVTNTTLGGGVSNDIDLDSHQALIGLRYRFN